MEVCQAISQPIFPLSTFRYTFHILHSSTYSCPLYLAQPYSKCIQNFCRASTSRLVWLHKYFHMICCLQLGNKFNAFALVYSNSAHLSLSLNRSLSLSPPLRQRVFVPLPRCFVAYFPLYQRFDYTAPRPTHLCSPFYSFGAVKSFRFNRISINLSSSICKTRLCHLGEAAIRRCKPKEKSRQQQLGGSSSNNIFACQQCYPAPFAPLRTPFFNFHHPPLSFYFMSSF